MSQKPNFSDICFREKKVCEKGLKNMPVLQLLTKTNNYDLHSYIGHPRKAGSEGYFKKLSKPLFHWDHRHPLGPKQLLFYDFLKKCAAGAL